MAAVVPRGAPAQPATDRLGGLVDIALAENPSLAGIREEIAALEQRVVRAGAWTNPVFGVFYRNVPVDSFALGRVAMSMLAFTLEQQVPFPGKLDRRRAVAEQQVTARRFALAESRNQLAYLVRRAYYELALSRRLEELTREHLEIAGQLVATVRTQYEVGRAPQQDLLRVEVLRDRLRDDLDDFARQQRTLVAAINAALHRTVATPVATPAELEVEKPGHDLGALLELAYESRPVLKQLAATEEMQRQAAELARYEAIPDPVFSVGYGIRTDPVGPDTGTDLVTLGVAVSVPAFYGSTYGALAEEALAGARAAAAQRQAVADEIASDLTEALATWRRAADQLATYRRQLIPQARGTLDAALSSYRVGRSDFLSVYDAELQLLDLQRVAYEAAAAGAIARARVRLLLGRELP